MGEEEFQKLYAKLNPKQKEAVDAIHGPVMVIAGPGTGKTSILTLRIANILKRTDTSPDSILALTFTESGVYSMRRKLVEIMGSAAYRVGIFTFHGFANHLIGRFGESFPRIVGGRSATIADQVEILENIFIRNRFARIRPFGDIFHYVPKALQAIHELKREAIAPKEFCKRLHREMKTLKSSPGRFHTSGRFKGELKAQHRDRLRRIEKSLELATVYARYEEALVQERLFDFEDMLLEAVRALREDENLRLTLQESYQYLLADEHQDANNAQNALLELLASFDEYPNLFIVGDEKQAIYRFQGATLENFLYFRKRFPRAKLITLRDNYRSSQHILDAAHSLMEKGVLPEGLPQEILRPRLQGQRSGARGDVRFFEFVREEHEISLLLEDIAAKIKAGVPPREIAVLIRDNADALALVDAFERTSIPFSCVSDDDILKDEELRKLIMVLRSVSAPGNPRLFMEMLHLEFLGISPIETYRLLSFCNSRRISVFETLREPKLLSGAKLRKPETLLRVFSDFCRWAAVGKNSGAGEAMQVIARESGFVEHLLSHRGSLRGLEKLDRLFNHLKEFSGYKRHFSLADFLHVLDRLEKHNLRLAGRSARPEFLDAVTLTTAHRAKGLEFEYVYLIGATDGHWGGRRGRDDFYLPLAANAPTGEFEDERRLFFVALTRAKKQAVITMSREGKGGKPKLPSQFVEDIDGKFVRREQTAGIEKRLSLRDPLYLLPRINTGPSLTLKTYLQKVFLEQGLTVTALNNYLSCPWEYFFKNLVRLPALPEPHLLFGTAVHEALHAFFEKRAKGERTDKRALVKFFDAALERTPLPLREFTDFRRKGRAALSGYFDAYGASSAAPAHTEFEIRGVFLPLNKKTKLLLRGKLDRIDRNPDGTVTVTDYKTGKPRSRAEILGETKSSNGNMKRQLDFYKLLLDRFDGGTRGTKSMSTGIIDFVEPDAKGRYRREVFAITEKDASAVAKEAIRVGNEIYALEFWGRHCNERNCDYCRLSEMMKSSKEAGSRESVG